MKNIEKRIKKIIVKKLGVKEKDISKNASFVDDLNADSLDIVELIMSLEEEFDIEISDKEAEKIHTIKNAIEYIQHYYDKK